MIRIAIADDQKMIRDSLRIVLNCENDFHVSGVAEDGALLLDLLQKEPVDVVLMDVRMPRMDGVLATREVKKRYPHVKIIILTTFDDDDFVYSALRYGASGYLLKGLEASALADAIRTVYSGGAMINPGIASKVVSMFARLGTTPGIEVDETQESKLNAMEWSVIREVAKGHSNKEISKVLYLSEGTIRNYLSTILSKLDLRDRTQLAIWALQSGKVL